MDACYNTTIDSHCNDINLSTLLAKQPLENYFADQIVNTKLIWYRHRMGGPINSFLKCKCPTASKSTAQSNAQYYRAIKAWAFFTENGRRGQFSIKRHGAYQEQ